MKLSINQYVKSDYPELKKLYISTGWFDPETDSEEKISKQIDTNPDGVLLAIDGEMLVGSITILPTGRLGLLFRLVTIEKDDKTTIREYLIRKAQEILKNRGYNQVHLIAPENEGKLHAEYERYGFIKGNPYRWFWKKIS